MRSIIFLCVITICLASCGDCGHEADIIVVGGGLMGSSTAWHLSDEGQDVLLIEQQDSIYTYGSSYGEARIARSSNRGNDMWSYLHNTSVSEVEKLLDYLNTDNRISHVMDDIYTTNPVTYVGRNRIYEKLYKSLIRQNVDYKIATTVEEGQELFKVNLPDSVLMQREYNPYSGTINPKALIKKIHAGVRNKGNRIWYNYKVLSITNDGCCYHIKVIDKSTGEEKEITSAKVVSAAGPYTGPLLQNLAPYMDDLINPERVFLAYLKIKDTVYDLLTNAQKRKIKAFYPVINSAAGTRHGSFFSMIEYYDNENPVIKIGGHFQRSSIADLDKVWQQQLTSSEIEWSLSNTYSYMQMLNIPIKEEDLELVSQYSCVYSLTDTEVPLVTPIINENNEPDNTCIVLGGLSGVGAKGAMAYGRIAADLMLDKNINEDPMYMKVKEELGFRRLLSDLNKVEKNN